MLETMRFVFIEKEMYIAKELTTLKQAVESHERKQNEPHKHFRA
jgi:hypothetical protein